MRWTCMGIILTMLLSGCATFTETFETRSHCGVSRVYCGTRVDAAMIAAATDESAGVLRAFWPLAMVDLPLSLAADTLLLPYTVYLDSAATSRYPVKSQPKEQNCNRGLDGSGCNHNP